VVKKKPFNSSLEEKLKALQAREPAPAGRPARPERRPAPQATAARDAPARPPSDDDLWASAVSGVERLEDPHGSVGPPPPAQPQPFRDPDLDALEELRALVQGERPFDLADSDEFVEGWVSGLDHDIVRRLRRGDYAVQGHLDLHGMTKDAAKVAVEAFLRTSRNAGKRCVLLVHGRGLHSKDQTPVLKEALRTWLVTARFGKHVLAFATARPQDGGSGAAYVLLRKLGR
jgi:DNA-nicking Smr family endonuclease